MISRLVMSQPVYFGKMLLVSCDQQRFLVIYCTHSPEFGLHSRLQVWQTYIYKHTAAFLFMVQHKETKERRWCWLWLFSSSLHVFFFFVVVVASTISCEFNSLVLDPRFHVVPLSAFDFCRCSDFLLYSNDEHQSPS